jgi:DNA-binding transcriptional LysR family regulator
MIDTALRYLHEAAIAGTMRAAGDKIGVAVSSISRQIAQLEAEYGTPFIERGRREIRLTEAGKLALAYYRDSVAEREAFQGRLRDLLGVRTGRISLAVGEGFLDRTFTDLIGDFRRRNPLVEIIVTSASTTEIVRRIADDDAHLGLVFQAAADPKIRIRLSIPQPLVVLAAPHHRLAARGSLFLRELVEEDLCLGPSDFRIRQLLHEVEARQHFMLEPRLVSNSIFVMREAVRSGEFLTILPRNGAWSELCEGTIKAIPLDDEDIAETRVDLIHRTGRQLEGAPTRFLPMLEAELRKWAQPLPGNAAA